ncbi:MAG: protein-L-isoaspartate(D-aspartate) O-methyltransferase [Polyangiaceae bacterium]
MTNPRARMVEEHLARRGIRDPRVLAAFLDVPRERFLSDDLRALAYDDGPLPIGDGQTISQPYIVAYTVEALGLGGEERVLEVGTGSGYAAAILARVASRVFTIERLPGLARVAKERFAALGFTNVETATGDGSLGWPEHAPYDAIAVAASGPVAPPSLLQQLAPGGRLVMPIGRSPTLQELVRITRGTSSFHEERLTHVRYVPLIGAEAWADPAPAGAPRG